MRLGLKENLDNEKKYAIDSIPFWFAYKSCLL